MKKTTVQQKVLLFTTNYRKLELCRYLVSLNIRRREGFENNQKTDDKAYSQRFTFAHI